MTVNLETKMTFTHGNGELYVIRNLNRLGAPTCYRSKLVLNSNMIKRSFSVLVSLGDIELGIVKNTFKELEFLSIKIMGRT